MRSAAACSWVTARARLRSSIRQAEPRPPTSVSRGIPRVSRSTRPGPRFLSMCRTRDIEVVDLATGANRSLPTGDLRSNFPMAIDRDAHRVLVVFRSPATLMALSSQDGRVAAKLETCGDADDVFVDPRRRRVYVSCGEGVVDVLEQSENGYRHLARVPTVSGARTSLFVPELDRLFVAVRANSNEPAAIWVFRPVP